MSNGPLEQWAAQTRRTNDYASRRALIAKRLALTKRPGETDVVPKFTDTDAAFVAHFDDRARRLAQLLDFCDTQKAIAEARRVTPKQPPEEPKC